MASIASSSAMLKRTSNTLVDPQIILVKKDARALRFQTENISKKDIIYVGIMTNVGLAAMNVTAGWILHSKTLRADALHIIFDALTDCVALVPDFLGPRLQSVSSSLSVEKLEGIISFFLSSCMLAGGLSISLGSLHMLSAGLHDRSIDLGLENPYPAHAKQEAPSIHAVWPALVTVLVKELLYLIVMRIAKRQKSAILASNALHHRSDSLGSIVTVVTILGGALFDCAAWSNAAGSLITSSVIVYSSLKNTLLVLGGL